MYEQDEQAVRDKAVKSALRFEFWWFVVFFGGLILLSYFLDHPENNDVVPVVSNE